MAQGPAQWVGRWCGSVSFTENTLYQLLSVNNIVRQVRTRNFNVCQNVSSVAKLSSLLQLQNQNRIIAHELCLLTSAYVFASSVHPSWTWDWFNNIQMGLEYYYTLTEMGLLIMFLFLKLWLTFMSEKEIHIQSQIYVKESQILNTSQRN